MKIFRKTICILIIVCFLATIVTPNQALAQGAFSLPAPGSMVGLSPQFTPAILRGIRVYPDNALKFDFIVDSGDTGLKGSELKDVSERLIKYFLTALTIPEDNLWVNLSPHEQDRIIPNSLAVTDMGTDMLSQDYLLKQITASLIYPEDELGKQFWQKIYKKAYEQYGTTNIPVDTFNKVWIMPDKAEVYVKDDRAFVVESKLKVMLEEDYVALNSSVIENSAKKADNKLASEIVREIVIPALEKEVNEGKNFAQLRQIYNSLVLAYWFKNNLKESIVNKVYSDQSKIKGVDTKDISKDIYNQYVKSFEKGVCDFVKVEYDQYTRKNIPRKYFSGGVVGSFASSNIIVTKADSRRGRRAGSNLRKFLTNATLVILVTVSLTVAALASPSFENSQESNNKSQVHKVDLGSFSRLEFQDNLFSLSQSPKEKDSLKSSRNKNPEIVDEQEFKILDQDIKVKFLDDGTVDAVGRSVDGNNIEIYLEAFYQDIERISGYVQSPYSFMGSILNQKIFLTKEGKLKFLKDWMHAVIVHEMTHKQREKNDFSDDQIANINKLLDKYYIPYGNISTYTTYEFESYLAMLASSRDPKTIMMDLLLLQDCPNTPIQHAFAAQMITGETLDTLGYKQFVINKEKEIYRKTLSLRLAVEYPGIVSQDGRKIFNREQEKRSAEEYIKQNKKDIEKKYNDGDYYFNYEMLSLFMQSIQGSALANSAHSLYVNTFNQKPLNIESYDFSKIEEYFLKRWAEGFYLFNNDTTDFEKLSKQYGLSKESLKAAEKLFNMNFDILGKNFYADQIPTWKIIALSKEPRIAKIIARDDFQKFYYRVNDTIFKDRRIRNIEDVFGACDLYNFISDNPEYRDLLYSDQFQETLDYVREKFPDKTFSVKEAVPFLILSRTFNKDKIDKIVRKLENEGEWLAISDLFLIDYIARDKHFYDLLSNRKLLEQEIKSKIYAKPLTSPKNKNSRLSIEDTDEYSTLFLLRSLAMYEALQNESFTDSIAQFYYQDVADKTAETGKVMFIDLQGSLMFENRPSYLFNDDVWAPRGPKGFSFASMHFHTGINKNKGDTERMQFYPQPSGPDYSVSRMLQQQGFVFAAVKKYEDSAVIDITAYTGHPRFSRLGILSLKVKKPRNFKQPAAEKHQEISKAARKEAKGIKEILEDFIREEIYKRENQEAKQGNQNLKPQKENDQAIKFQRTNKNKNKEISDPEELYYINLANNIKKNPDKYAKELIKNFLDIAPFFKDINDFREILKDAMNKHPDLAIKFWAYSYFESEKQPQILLGLIGKSPIFGLQNFNAKFRSKDLQEEFTSGLVEILENNPDVVFEYADNIVQRNSDFFFSKDLGFSRKLKKKTKNEKISLLISSLRILAGSKMPYDNEHINNAISLAIDFQKISGNEIYYDKNTTVINILNVEEKFLVEEAEELAELGGVLEDKIFSFKGGKDKKEDVIKALKASRGSRVVLFRGHNTPIFERDEVENYDIGWEALHKNLVDNNFAEEEHEQMKLIADLDEIKEYLKTAYDQDAFNKISHFLDITANRLAFDYGEYLNYEEIASALSESGDFSQTRFFNLSCDSYNHNWSFTHFLNQKFSQNPQVTVSEADRGEPGSGKEADYLRSIIKTVRKERGSDEEKKPIFGRHFLAAKTDAVRKKQHPIVFFFPGKEIIKDLFVQHFNEKGEDYYNALFDENDNVDNLPEGGVETGWILNAKKANQNPLLAFQVSLSPNNSVNENNILFGKLNTDILDQGEILGVSQGDTFLPSEFYDMTAMMFTSILQNKDLEVFTENEGRQLLVEKSTGLKKASSSQIASSEIKTVGEPGSRRTGDDATTAKEVKMIISDLTGTLVTDGIAEGIEYIGEYFGISDINKLVDVFKTGEEAAKYRTKPEYEKAYWEYALRSMEELFAAHTPDSVQHRRRNIYLAQKEKQRPLLQDFLVRFYKPIKGRKELLEKLEAKGLRVEIFTNMHSITYNILMAMHELKFLAKYKRISPIILGVSKKDPNVYQRLFEFLKAQDSLLDQSNRIGIVSLKQLLYIEDAKSLVEKARNSGLETVRVISEELLENNPMIKSILSRDAPNADTKSSKNISSTGGIDFNAENMNITTKGGQIDFDIPLDMQNVDLTNIDGFTPVIINITPITSFTGLLGLDDQENKDQKLALQST